MHACHHGWLIVLKLRVVRQIPGIMPDQSRRGGDAHQEHHGSGGEQETHEPHQKAHYRSSVSAIAPSYSGTILSVKICRGTICQSAQAHNTSAVSVVRSIPRTSR